MKPYRSESDLDQPPKKRVWPWVLLLLVLLGLGAYYLGPVKCLAWWCE